MEKTGLGLYLSWKHVISFLLTQLCLPFCDLITFILFLRTIMGPHGINRAVHRISFSDCQNGLGNQGCTLLLWVNHTPGGLCQLILGVRKVDLAFLDLAANTFSTAGGITNFSLLSFFVCCSGVKIIGGYRAQTAEDYGIFIKRILPGGVAAVDSK